MFCKGQQQTPLLESREGFKCDSPKLVEDADQNPECFVCLFCFFYVSVDNFSVMSVRVLLGPTCTKQWTKHLVQGHNHSDLASSETRTRNPCFPRSNALSTEPLHSTKMFILSRSAFLRLPMLNKISLK